MCGMEPVPETAQVLDHLDQTGQELVRLALQEMVSRTTAIVPECVGMSVGLVEKGLTFTFVATDETAAALDATQYADGGPCADAAELGEPVGANIDDLLDEEQWLMFARASAAAGVASSLSLTLLDVDEGEVIGGVNLYASTPRAFEGRHKQIAEALGASAEGIVSNADLSFSAREWATSSPAQLHVASEIDLAVGIIMERHGVDADAARARLRDAAVRSGITEEQAARAIRHVQDDA